MSHTLTEPVLSVESAKAALPPEPRKPIWWIWGLRVLLLLAAVWLADTSVSFLIQHTTLKRRLTSRLSAAFGRQVEVGSYGFSVWSGPALEAHSLVVAEDPRFGQEYFLRADFLQVRIAWRSLLTGHLELGTISLSQPSLNLVRNADGDWNLAEWLPRPANANAAPDPGPASVASFRFRKIEVADGRVNFKRGDDKLPFAFSGVKGTLETEGRGRWRLDLLAVPWRAAAIVQQPGVFHLLGHVGGTSSRLRPSVLQLDWSDASITDVFRLLEGHDYGIRGNMALTVSAHTDADVWHLEGNAALALLHRWDLALRSDDPSLSISAKGNLDANGSRLELNDARIDAPHSSARVLGALDWTASNPNLTRLQVISEAISVSDLLAWARAFHPNIANNVALDGFAHAELSLAGWPPRVDSGNFNLTRTQLTGIPRNPVRAGPVEIRYDAKGFTLAPVTIGFGGASGSIRVDGSARPDLSDLTAHVQGTTTQVRDVISFASQFGWDLARGWEIAGPMRCDLRWQARRRPWHSELAGSLEWGTPAVGDSLHAKFLNLPVEQIRGRAELTPVSTHVLLSSARAFGAHWTGTFDHDLAGGWRFIVSGDQLSATNLERWLNPRWRQSFVDRILPFLTSRATATASPESVRARGRISLDDFTLDALVVQRLRGDLNIDARHLGLSDMQGQLEDGAISGSFLADLEPASKYEGTLEFSGIDLKSMSASFPSLAGLFTGSASGRFTFNTRGSTVGDLVSSLECRGSARAKDGWIAGIRLPNPLLAAGSETDSYSMKPGDASPGIPVPPLIAFRDASAAFTCADSKIQFQDLLLRDANTTWDGTGTVDYGRNLNLRFRSVSSNVIGPRVAKPAGASKDEYQITGSLKSPRIQRIASSGGSTENH